MRTKRLISICYFPLNTSASSYMDLFFIICRGKKPLSPISALFYTLFSPGSTHHPSFLTTSLLNQNILKVVVGINRTQLKCYGL